MKLFTCHLKHYNVLLVTSYCTLCRKYGVCALRMQVLRQEKGWERARWMGHLQGNMHTVAAKLGCQSAMVGTGSVPGFQLTLDTLI